MPLPAAGQDWPPKSITPAYDLMDVHDAWYVGDPDILATVYRNRPYNLNHPAQYRGGIIGTMARMWWGKPVPMGDTRTRLHLPVPSDISTMSADLLFSEPPRFVLPDASKTSVDGTVVKSKAQAAVEAVVNVPEVFTALLEAAELGSALGGTYLRLIWDRARMDHVRIDPVAADNALPTFANGVLQSVLFWTVVSDLENADVLRHVELHEPGRITHALYKGSRDKLGTQVGLAEAGGQLDWLTTLDAPSVAHDGNTVILGTGLTDLTACYIPNILPNRLFRKNGYLASFGRSDYASVEPGFDAIDEAWSSWSRDIRLAKARIIVPTAYLENLGPGGGAQFDTDREVYEGLDFLTSDPASKTITPQQFQIRVQDHKDTITEWTRYVLRSAGFSGSSVGEGDAVGVRTATQITAEERLSERTRDKKTNYWKAALGRFVRTWMELESIVYQNEGLRLQDSPEVRFPAESQQDPAETAQLVAQLATSASASVMTRVRTLHPDWDGGTVNQEVERIYQEQGIGPAQIPDAATYRGILADAIRKPMGAEEAAQMEQAAKARAG